MIRAEIVKNSDTIVEWDVFEHSQVNYSAAPPFVQLSMSAYKSESHEREEKKIKFEERSNVDDIKLFSDDDFDFCRNRTAVYKSESHDDDEKEIGFLF
ncbi:hypothetical protein TNCV_2417651 [Trichonephila clavipes]|nr:hypothetical protein TNCV_2417651 [Trichonephila clavipes]